MIQQSKMDKERKLQLLKLELSEVQKEIKSARQQYNMQLAEFKRWMACRGGTQADCV